MLVWVVDAGNFGCCLAYCMVSVSFVVLRTKAPGMERPYQVKHYKPVGAAAILMSGIMVAMYMIPGSGCTLVAQEWAMAGGWALLGVVFYAVCKLKYKEKFATHIDVAVEDGAAVPDEVETALEEALETVHTETVVRENVPAMDFSYFLPVNIVFGRGKADQIGDLARPYGKKALVVTGRSSAKKSGLYDRVAKSLSGAGIAHVLFDKAEPNPLTTTAEEGAAFAKANGCDMVAAIGGGAGTLSEIAMALERGRPVFAYRDLPGSGRLAAELEGEGAHPGRFYPVKSAAEVTRALPGALGEGGPRP